METPMKYSLGIVITCLLVLPSSAWAQLDVDAGPDVTLECASADGTDYTLNGSVPDEEGLTFEWSTDNDVELKNDDTLTPTGVFPLGDTIVGLAAMTELDTGDDSTTISVEDSTPPVVRARAEPRYLWPPNHKMHNVRVRLVISDNCTNTDDFEVELVSATSDEPDNSKGDGNTRGDIQDADTDTDDRHVRLRAERKGNGDGRVYTLTYRVTDGGGNGTEVEAKVHVPHDAHALRNLIDNEGDDTETQPICTEAGEAVEEYVELMPSPSDFASARSCVNACRVWSRGCKDVVRDARKCLRSELKNRSDLGDLICRDDDGREDRRACANDLRGELRNARAFGRSEGKRGKNICAEAARDCAETCRDYVYID
jgi:hypothetical protein